MYPKTKDLTGNKRNYHVWQPRSLNIRKPHVTVSPCSVSTFSRLIFLFPITKTGSKRNRNPRHSYKLTHCPFFFCVTGFNVPWIPYAQVSQNEKRCVVFSVCKRIKTPTSTDKRPPFSAHARFLRRNNRSSVVQGKTNGKNERLRYSSSGAPEVS